MKYTIGGQPAAGGAFCAADRWSVQRELRQASSNFIHHHNCDGRQLKGYLSLLIGMRSIDKISVRIF